MKLDDKLDCRFIIDEIVKSASGWNFVFYDPVGWLAVGRRLKFHKITAAALDDVTRTFSPRNMIIARNNTVQPMLDTSWQARVDDARSLLVDETWLELDPAT